MDEFSPEASSPVKRDKKNLLLTSKDPHLSHLFGDDPKTPNSMGSTELTGQSVMEDSSQLHDEESSEPEYRLFDEQSYVPDLSPSNQMRLESGSQLENSVAIQNEPTTSKLTEKNTGTTNPRPSRRNGPIKVKPFPCKEPGCRKSYVDARALRIHVSKCHSNDVNNNSVVSHNGRSLNTSEREQTEVVGSNSTPLPNQRLEKTVRTNESNYHASNTAVSTGLLNNGPDLCRLPSSDPDANLTQSNNESSNTISFTSQDNNHYNMQLLAHSAQHLLRNQHDPAQQLTNQTAQPGTDYTQHQSSSALQQFALRAQLRSFQGNSIQESPINSCESGEMLGGESELHIKLDYSNVSIPGQMNSVRAQLRKSLSSSGKLETVNAMQMPRMQMAVGGGNNLSMDSRDSFYIARTINENDPSNIDNAPLLKGLLANTNRYRNKMLSMEDNSIVQNGVYQHNDITGNNWSGGVIQQQQPHNDLRSPVLTSKRHEFSYQCGANNMIKTEHPNQSPLNSPTYPNAPHFTVQQHNQTTPLPQNNEQQFFGPEDIMVNNNNNQQMAQEDQSPTNLNEMIKESENLVQDLIDEAEASSSQGSQHLMSYNDGGPALDSALAHCQGRVTPPPAYHLNSSTALVDQNNISGEPPPHMSLMYNMGHNPQIKSEPQSPMITSPMGQRIFFGPQAPPMGVHPNNMQPLSSPTTPHHQVPMQPGMQPHTPTADAQWQYPISGQHPQNYGSIPQSPTTLVQSGSQGISQVQSQDNPVQNINYIPHTRPTTMGNPKSTRTRRTSGGSGRKNPDGTLSCGICGHSFRSVPALNGHMRVHSSSSEKKIKDDRQRKTSGSSSGGNGSRTPKSLSSPTTPTFNKVTPPASMYQNAAVYNSVTVSPYSNPPALYNPALTTMDGTPLDASLVRGINPQIAVSGLYPYSLQQHMPQMHPPTNALLAAANLFRSERSPISSHEEFQRQGGNLPPIPDLQNISYFAQQQASFRNTPPGGMILVQPQSSIAQSYLARQGDYTQAGSVTTLPFVTVPVVSTTGTIGRQAFPGSPPQEHSSIAPNLENIQYIQQPLLQQTNHRSTPLADFADIAVLHNQGQLFTSNTMLLAQQHPNHSHQTEGESQAMQQHQRQQIQIQDVSSDVGLLASMPKEMLWRPDSQQHSSAIPKLERSESMPMKGEVFLPAQIDKSTEGLRQQNQMHDPFIFPVSVPVHCLRNESATVTTTIQNYYRPHFDDYSSNMFPDDSLMQDAINTANPSTILPNSMMGGNPSGPSFRSFRQRHHSEGSVLKKTWQPELPPTNDMKPLKTDIISSFPLLQSKTPPANVNGGNVIEHQSISVAPTIAGNKRKSGTPNQKGEIKKQKLGHFETSGIASSEPVEVKKEVWMVPKHAPPIRQRHRRHSADSRLPYRSGSLYSRAAYLSSCQMGTAMAGGKGPHGRPTTNVVESRGKRRPPPLIIPPSVNACSNGTLFLSQLHHRRRPSGDSVSSCGNERFPPYTPPPMLSPIRPGTGLYYTPSTPSLKPLLRQVSIDHGPISTIPEEDIEDEELVRSADPKINIGSEYQAELPKLCSRSKLKRDKHCAKLVWKPSPEISTDNSTQSRHVEEYLKLACSAAVPHGGCNKEFALHLLHKNKGDILNSVRQLLQMKVKMSSNHWMATYTYTGASRWSMKERQTFERANMEHRKDFYKIAKMVETKNTAECVDYYYHTIKRRKRRIQRPRRFRRDSEEEENKLSPDDLNTYLSDENDFLKDHISEIKQLLPQIYIKQELKSSEIVRRSPTSTAFVRGPPPVNRVIQGIPQTQHLHQPLLTFAPAAQHIPQIHSYARPPMNMATEQRHLSQGARTVITPLVCKFPNCTQSFTSLLLRSQHEQTHKASMKPYLDRLNQASPSPASSPGSVASEADAPQFQCPRCGKSFGKVKSRNAHMKTHGKLAQEKRRQKEEEARRKIEEAATWRNRTQQQRIMHPPKARELVQYQQVASPHTKPPGM